jgi:hypothetical protein
MKPHHCPTWEDGCKCEAALPSAQSPRYRSPAEAYERGLRDGYEQGRAEAATVVEAAIRLIGSDHITPMGARQLRATVAVPARAKCHCEFGWQPECPQHGTAEFRKGGTA